MTRSMKRLSKLSGDTRRLAAPGFTPQTVGLTAITGTPVQSIDIT